MAEKLTHTPPTQQDMAPARCRAWWRFAPSLLVALGVLAACGGSNATSQAAETPAPPLLAATATVVESVTQPSTEAAERASWRLGVAALEPFSQDGPEPMSQALFGDTEQTQQEGLACFETNLAELVDIAALVERTAQETDRYLDLLESEHVGARQAFANCVSADRYRSLWIGQHVAGYNKYRRGENPALSPTNPCFAPAFDSPQQFVAAVVELPTFEAQGYSQVTHLGPFPCL